ncbi:MAG: hypothetical protein GY801_37845 [bacterium]|nr:hypothetical protein [bacterium]
MLKQRFSRVCPCEVFSERANAMPRGRRGDSARWTLRLPPRAKAPLQHSSFIPGIIKEPTIFSDRFFLRQFEVSRDDEGWFQLPVTGHGKLSDGFGA